LLKGAKKAREISVPYLAEIRYAVGIRALGWRTDLKISENERIYLGVYPKHHHYLDVNDQGR
jgi:hypothetical protein